MNNDNTFVTTPDAVEHRISIGFRPAVRRYRLTGNEEHHIAVDDAARLTASYRKEAGPDAFKAAYFGKEILRAILAQEGCVGIRAYYAKHHDGTPTFVLTGADENGNDLYDGVLAQDPWSCPPWCSEVNVLNSDNPEIAGVFQRRPMSLTGAESHFVTLAEASEYTRLYRESKRIGDSKAVYFGRRISEEILGQDGCVGMRLYLAKEDSGRRTLVLAGVNADGNDIVPGILGEQVWDCPPWCSVVNPLNR